MKDNTTAKLGTMPINKLILSLGIPMIVSMMLQALYNIVDSAFVSNIPENGEAALNALTLAFPVQMLMVAVSIGTGVGVNALVAKNLGQGKTEKASETVGNAWFLSVAIYALCLIFGIFGVKAYIGTQTENAQIFNMGVRYLRICTVSSAGIIFFSMFEKTLQATGLSLYSTIAQISGALINIILDPILIYGFFGLPDMGVDGAAYATVIGQMASAVIGLVFHVKLNKTIKNKIKYINPSLRIIKQIYSIGLPAIIAQALMSIMTYCLNIILVQVDETMVTAYGLYYKIQQFILFAAFGLRDAITPIISFNHGMGDKSRVKQGIRYGILYTLIIMAAGLIIIEIFAKYFSGLFGLSGMTRDLFVSAMRIISVSFIFAGLNIAFQGIYQALESGLESLIISLCRQLIFVLPIAWGFAAVAIGSPENKWLVWLTFPIAEFVSAIVGSVFMGRINKSKIEVMS